jgi:3'-phosphoadenosine 5'-phosphosulfate sulfotransferase (PAPS reductase)/FAD synthetase
LCQDKIINLFGLSGGKDSLAALLWGIHESGYDLETIRVTFCDTENEATETYDYVHYISKRVHHVEWISPDLGFYDLAKKNGRFPSARARFCTTELKMIPTQAWIRERQAEGYTVINHSGVRAGESDTRKHMAEWESAEESFFGCIGRRPLIRWSLDDVWAIHDRWGVPRNPLYAKGASRVGCYPCIMSRKAEILNIAIKSPERFDMIREQEPLVGNRNFSSFFARDKVPLRFRTKIIQAPVKQVKQEALTPRGRWEGAYDDEAQGWLELVFSDDYGEIINTPEEAKQAVLMQDMAVCSIDDVIRWAMSGVGETEELEYDDLEYAPSCSSGMCE